MSHEFRNGGRSLLPVSLVLTTLTIMSILVSTGFAQGDPKAARALTVGEGFVDPLGFHDPTPVFSWKLPEGVKKQTGYRIEARGGPSTWDSGWVESDQSTFVAYRGNPFASRNWVQWRVRYRDENGTEYGWSAPAHFELGLLSASDWQAQWIRPSQESDPIKEPVGWLRRGFSVGRQVARARIYVTARGLFELRLNGDRVSKDHFAMAGPPIPIASTR